MNHIARNFNLWNCPFVLWRRCQRVAFFVVILAVPVTEAFGLAFYDGFEQPMLTKRFLDQWGIFCRTAFEHIPSPQITNNFLAVCDLEDRVMLSGLNEPMIQDHRLVFRNWFFVPYEPQWIHTVPLVQALYHPQDGTEGKVRVLRNLGKMPSPLVSYHWYIDVQKAEPNLKDLYRTQIWTAQLAPYNRDDYLLIEVLVKHSGTLTDLKRVIGILPTEGGGVVLHDLAMEFSPGTLKVPMIEAHAKQFETQNKNLRDLIFRDLGNQYRVSPLRF